MPLEGFRIFNCVFEVFIIQLFKAVYGALLIYVMFFENSFISKQHFLYTLFYFSQKLYETFI